MKNVIKKIYEVKLCLMSIINVNYLKMLKVQYPNESEEDLKEIAEEFSLITNNDQEGLKKFYLRKYQKKVF